MTLAEKINNDLKEAMKNKDSFKLGVIRMVKGAMQLEKPNPREELTDDDVIKVISKQIKMRKESIAQFEAANRNDLVEQNKKEIAILEEYMPEQLSEEELNVVKAIVKKLQPKAEIIEANYSKDIINQDNPNFDHVCRGHMELRTTLDFLNTNDNPSLMNVVLLHLSDSNSNSEYFSQKTKELIPRANVYVADKGMEIELNKEPF